MSKKWAASITADIASPEKPILIDEITFDGVEYPAKNLAACKRNGHWFYRSADPARTNDPWNFWREVVDPCDDLKFNQVAQERVDEIEIWGAFNRSPFRYLLNEGDKPMNPPNEPNAPVGAQTPPPPEQNPDCPKCGQVIYLTQDTQPDGRIICDACKARYKNLEALLKAIEQQRQPPAVILGRSIPVDLIDPNPEQPRQDFAEAELTELAESIRAHGVIQAITVEPALDKTRYILHDGERRLRAAKLAGLTEIPAVVVEPGSDPKHLLLRAIVANDQRADLSPIERARGYQKLADEHGLSDSQIATQVSKSRSVVANTRRLLNLPQELQEQVAKGDLNERQALALLPLYALPANLQKKVLDTWEGKKLEKPQNLTSDQIRSSLNAGIRQKGQEISLIEADQVYNGDGIRSPTCTGCDLYLKVGGQMLCLDKPCLETKQAQVMAIYLQQASARTGLPYLDPAIEENSSQTDRFYSTTGARALELARQNNCPNLRLEYRRNSWSGGPGPEEFGQCSYTCLHNGQGCACYKDSKAKAEAADKENEKAHQQLIDQAIQHLSELIKSNHPRILTAIFHAMIANYYGGRTDKIWEMSPENISRELAKKLIERETNLTPYRPVETNQQAIDNWLTRAGLPVLGQNDLVSKIDARLERIAEWIKGLRKTVPTPEQVKGNLTNLDELANEAQRLQDAGSDQDRTQLAERKIFNEFKSILLALQPIVESQAVEIEHVSWLLTVPSGDDNFQGHLKAVNQTTTLDYTLCLFPLFNQGKTAREAIERRRRKIEKETPSSPSPLKGEGRGEGDFCFARDGQGEASNLQLDRCWKCGDGQVRSYVRLPGQQYSGNICEKCGHVYVGMDFHHKRPVQLPSNGKAPYDHHLAALREQLSLITGILEREPAPPLLTLKEYRNHLTQLIQPLAQTDPEPPGLQPLLAQWEQLDDHLDDRIKNFQFKPLKLDTPQPQEVAA